MIGISKDILNMIANDSNVDNKLKKIIKGEPMSKMGELVKEQEKKYDGTEGLSEDQLKEQMDEGYVKHMGQFVLKKVRLELGYNQQQMADALGYTRKDIICGIENGNRTMSGVAVRCLEYLIQIKDLKEMKPIVLSPKEWKEKRIKENCAKLMEDIND